MRERSVPAHSLHRPPRRPPRIAAGPRLPATSGCAPLRGRHIPAPPHPEGVAVSADLLSVRDLIVSFRTERGTVRALFGVSFSLAPGETLGLVGESGCGKTVTALSLLKLLPSPPAAIEGGRVFFRGRDLLPLPEDRMCEVRGKEISMIFQEPMTSLNPVLPIGDQVAEVFTAHRACGRTEAAARAVDGVRRVKMPDAERRAREYPHQLSGGMRQRAMIAMALALEPALLIADEPTTALDVTIQAQILSLLQEMREQQGMAILLITHDLGVVSEFADRVAIMYLGRIVEIAKTGDLFADPVHPYTQGLLRGGGKGRPSGLRPGPPPPRGVRPGALCGMPLPEEGPEGGGGMNRENGVLLRLENIYKFFPVRKSFFSSEALRVHAVDGVSIEVPAGKTVGLVGESGCGKTTLGRVAIRLVPPDSWRVVFEGRDITEVSGEDLRRTRRKMQIIFQDPYSSLNHRMRVRDIVGEGGLVHGIARGRGLRERGRRPPPRGG